MKIALYTLAALMIAPTIVLGYIAVFDQAVTNRQMGGAIVLIVCAVYAALSASEADK